MELPANLEALAPLIGTWAGQGHGIYPTIKDFDYQEQITFKFIGKPFLEYVQRTQNAEGKPMHTECGYLRHNGEGHIEFVLAQPTGQVEMIEGRVSNNEGELVLELEGAVWATSTAKDVSASRRCYVLRGDDLETSFDMAAVGQPLQRHLTSKMTRVRDN